MGELILMKTNTTLLNVKEQYFYYASKDIEYKVVQNFQIKLTKRKSTKHYFKIFLFYFAAVRFTNKLISLCVVGAR